MRLNPNCIRDILITVEENSDFYHMTEYKIEEPFKTLSDYSHEEIFVHTIPFPLHSNIFSPGTFSTFSFNIQLSDHLPLPDIQPSVF